jgi:nucleotide-binding universal stress UspA family protein
VKKLNFKFDELKRILVPVDGSDYSVRASEYAVSLAKKVGAELVVVYVIDSVVLDQMSKFTERENTELDLKADGERYVKYVVGVAQSQGVNASSFLARGIPFEQIVHLAKGLAVDLIIMGSYGRRGAERILIGSVAERVIEYTACPVLVVK